MVINDSSSLVRLQGLKPDKFVINLLPAKLARDLMVVPLWVEENKLVIACTESMDQVSLKQIEAACRRPVRPIRASYHEIQNALNCYYHDKPARHNPLDLGGILFQLGVLSPTSLSQLRSLESNSTETTASLCRSHHLIDDNNLAEAMGIYCSLPYLRLSGLKIPPNLAILFSWEVATERKIIPLWWIEGTLVVATPELVPGDRLEDISANLGIPIEPLICSYSDWEYLYKDFYLHGISNRQQEVLEVAQWLLKRGTISKQDLDNAIAASLQTGKPLEECLVADQLVRRSQWIQAQSAISGIPIASDVMDSPNESPDFGLANILPVSQAKKFLILPLQLENSTLKIAIPRPDQELVHLAEGLTGLKVVPYLLPPEEIIKRLDRYYPMSPPPHNLKVFPGLGQLLLLLGIVTRNQLHESETTGIFSDLAVGEKLISQGYLEELGLIEVLSLQTGIPRARLDHARFQPESFSELPLELIKQHLILPIWSNAEDLIVAVFDPLDNTGLREVEKATNKRIWPILAPRSTIMATLERLTGIEGKDVVDSRVLGLLKKLIEGGYLTQAGAASVIKKCMQENSPLDKVIADESVYSHKEISQAIASINELSFVDLQLIEQVVEKIGPLGENIKRSIIQDPVDEKVATLISYQNAEHLSALPIKYGGHGEIVVAFADPFINTGLVELEKMLDRKIIPVMAYRQDLEDAIQRTLGKRNIGSYLLLDGLISQSQLNDALDFARSTGVRLGQALVNRKYITDVQLYKYLSKQSSLPLFDLETAAIDKNVIKLISPQLARKHGILPVQELDNKIVLATVDPFNTQALDVAKELLGRDLSPALVTEKDFDRVLEKLYSREYLAESISHLLERSPQDSAYRVLNLGQIISLLVILVLSIFWLWSDFTKFIIILNSISTVFYIAFSSYKFYLVFKALSESMEVPVEPEELLALNDRDMPVYSILVPVYKEADVLPELLGALNRLDYPTTKLDIQVLMEEDDQETIEAFNNWNGPPHIHGVIVPYGEPKTKPKACNYGLIHARGDYLVIFDAEDIPEPDQLKKVIVAFSKSPTRVACIQSKLNYYNSEQNLLTRWFTVEYSMWFDLFLPGLSASNAPIPLGGTSNHFKRDVLVEIGAWDPYNVTEDADLGIRLFKRGYKVAIIDSTTYEEANSQIYNWMRQRSRWIKGYIQSWLVHMRNPLRLIKEIGFKAFFSFQFVVGGTFFAALMNPIYWFLTTLWFLVEWKFIQALFPGIVYFLGAVCLFAGNFAFTYLNVAGALRREQYSMVKYALLSPVYWAFASVAAWMGFIQLLYKPHFWEKTTHGLHTTNLKKEAPPTG